MKNIGNEGLAILSVYSFYILFLYKNEAFLWKSHIPQGKFIENQSGGMVDSSVCCIVFWTKMKRSYGSHMCFSMPSSLQKGSTKGLKD